MGFYEVHKGSSSLILSKFGQIVYCFLHRETLIESATCYLALIETTALLSLIFYNRRRKNSQSITVYSQFSYLVFILSHIISFVIYVRLIKQYLCSIDLSFSRNFSLGSGKFQVVFFLLKNLLSLSKSLKNKNKEHINIPPCSFQFGNILKKKS